MGTVRRRVGEQSRDVSNSTTTREPSSPEDRPELADPSPQLNQR